MKYKASDKLVYLDQICHIHTVIPIYDSRNNKMFSAEYEFYSPKNRRDIRISDKDVVPYIEYETVKVLLGNETTILNLNELNSIKTRQLDELMRFIAHIQPKAHKEYLKHHLSDVQLIDGILYHVRKGK